MSKDRAEKIGVGVGYWIYQNKGLTMDEFKKKADVPLHH